MFINIKDLHKKFVYQRKLYHTPVELSCDKESLSALIFKLNKQDIFDYTITPYSVKSSVKSNQKIKSKIVGKSFTTAVIDDIVEEKNPAQLRKYVDNNDDIRDMLSQILAKTNQLSESKNNKDIVYIEKNISEKRSISKTKDDEHTFIPEISTNGMEIKSKVKTKQSDNDAANSADVLRQLLKGI